jgi:PE-PPE domain
MGVNINGATIRACGRSWLLAGATLAVIAGTAGPTGAPGLPAPSFPIDLAAVITEGSSTNWPGSEVKNFYGVAWQQSFGDPVVELNFLQGPSGIGQALRDNAQAPKNVVISSGWGAANASAALSWLTVRASIGDQSARETLATTHWVLDNNVARPNGGWGTRYPIFALIGVNPVPTPTNADTTVLDVGYEYNANSNAPAYPLNFVADLNSLVAYAYGYKNQSQLQLPPEVDSLEAGQSVETDTYVVKKVGGTTYVTYKSDGLPLTRPLRELGPAGQKIADIIEPALTVIVNYGYPGNDPIAHPETYTPAGLIPGLRQTIDAAGDFVHAVHAGLTTIDADNRAAEKPRTADSVANSSDRSTATRPRAGSGRPPGPQASATARPTRLHATTSKAVRGPAQKRTSGAPSDHR